MDTWLTLFVAVAGSTVIVALLNRFFSQVDKRSGGDAQLQIRQLDSKDTWVERLVTRQDALEEDLVELRDANTLLVIENKDYKGRVERLESMVSEFKMEYKKLLDEVRAKDEKIAEQAKEITDLRNEVDTLKMILQKHDITINN